MGSDGRDSVCVCVIGLVSIALTAMGSALMVLGLRLRFNSNTKAVFEVESLKSWVFVMDVKIIIVLGSFMLVTALFGFYGGSSKKKWALETFAGLLGVLLFPAMFVVGYTLGNSNAIGRNIMEFYISMYVLYDGVDPVIGITLRTIHNFLHCCGVTGVQLIEMICPKPSGFLEHILMPNCPEKIAGFFDRKAPLIGFLVAYAVLLIITACCCSVLCKKNRASVSTTQYTVMSNSTLVTPQPFQHGFVPTSCSYPNPDPDLFPLVTVAEAPVVQA